jgi:signal transduction histidine kinase
MKSIRELSVDLNPTMLDNLGLLPALNWQLDRFSKLAHIDVQFTHRGLKRNFSPEIILSTYRIIQEALTNVALHSRVNEAAVTVLSKNRTINIIVEDKGKGFYLNTLDVRNSSGLSGMRERALAMGGKLNIETSPGTGTRVVAALPLQNRPKRKSLKHE